MLLPRLRYISLLCYSPSDILCYTVSFVTYTLLVLRWRINKRSLKHWFAANHFKHNIKAGWEKLSCMCTTFLPSSMYRRWCIALSSWHYHDVSHGQASMTLSSQVPQPTCSWKWVPRASESENLTRLCHARKFMSVCLTTLFHSVYSRNRCIHCV